MVTVQNLTKIYGTQIAVNNISFTAKPGEILGFLGPNGAGKSTTMKMITSFLKQDSGSISVCGFNTIDQAIETRKRIGYLPESNPLYFDMYVKEFLTFAGKIHKVENLKSRIDDIIGMTGLGKEQHKLIGALSKGYKQRVGIAQALLHNPEVIIMDEPTSGLDMNQLVDIRQLIKNLGKEKTIIFSTHIMQEVQALCDRVIIINEGQIVADDPIKDLQNRIKGSNLINITFNNQNYDLNAINNIAGVIKTEVDGNSIKVYTDDHIDLRPELFKLCASKNWEVIEMNIEKLSIEYIFQKLTKNNQQ
jgi:ABC-2 type transport system ATP-binding protein